MGKAGETVLEIDLRSLKHNYRYLRSKLKPETKFMAVVKAFAYGSDAGMIARSLEEEGVDYFAVAYTTEGITLRNAGITTPILVLHPLPMHFEEIIDYQLEPSIYSFKVLKDFIAIAEGRNSTDYPVHIKFNTGLNRLGFEPEDTGDMVKILSQSKAIKARSLFSHLGASEDINEKQFTLQQINSFKALSAEFIKKAGYTPWLHQLNTSGILNYSEIAGFDMVRSGIGLYGFGNDAKYDPFLKPVASLKSVISQIHHVRKGESIGYNKGFIAAEDIVSATIPIGHADGIGRQYGKGKGFVYINGKKAHILGNVCMDMLMVNISGIDCNEGDEVIVFGEGASAEKLAESAGTISYELLTGISQRVKRIFIK